MKLTLLAAGRLKAGPERSLVDTYKKRLSGRPAGLGPLTEIEINERHLTDAAKTASEYKRHLEAGTKRMVLDEKGQNLTSREFADLLARWQDSSTPEAALIIGPADGLPKQIRESADKLVSFGSLTWPHMLVRVMAAEQLYRAAMLLAGHPYHRD